MMSGHNLDSMTESRPCGRTAPHGLFVIGAALCATLAVSCGDSDAPGRLADDLSGVAPASGVDDAGGDVVVSSGLVNPDAVADHLGETAAFDTNLPSWLLTIQDPGCIDAAGQRTELLPASLHPPSFDRLSGVGDRIAAGGSLSQGFLTFDPDGANAAPALAVLGPDYNLFAAGDQLIGMAAGADTGILFQRYDAFQQPVGPAVELAQASADALAITYGGGRWLVVWAASGGVFAKSVDAAGAASQTQSVVQSAYETVVRLAASPSLQGFSVAIASDPPGEGRVTRMVSVAADGAPTRTVTLPPELPQHTLEKIVRTPNGNALLLSASAPLLLPLVVLIDDAGNASGFALEGGLRGSDLAAGQGRILVATTRETGEPQVRSFDSSMQPLGPWSCLGPPADVNDVVGVEVRGAGFAAVYRNADGATTWLSAP